MTLATAGLHHVSAIAVDPQGNLDWYTQVLGLRLVKQTVNFDDPGTYHFYFGDSAGHPGTLLTFFPFPLAGRGRPGAGMVAAVAFAAAEHAIEDWMVRLSEHGLDIEGPTHRFGETVIALRDPDGLRIEIVGGSPGHPEDTGISGLHSVTLALAQPDRTAALLTDVFGLRADSQESGRMRFRARSGASSGTVDLVASKLRDAPRQGGGSVHHIAFRARNDDEQAEWREAVVSLGLEPTGILDRRYFRSFYFREPGGVLFEVATDAPGFAVDEPAGALGRGLMLPEWLEPRRATIESRLPPVHTSGTSHDTVA